jgi:hypothetical protein
MGRSYIAPAPRGAEAIPTLGLVNGAAAASNANARKGAPPVATQSGRLLAAKRRASRR